MNEISMPGCRPAAVHTSSHPAFLQTHVASVISPSVEVKALRLSGDRMQQWGWEQQEPRCPRLSPVSESGGGGL